MQAEDSRIIAPDEVTHWNLSEVDKLTMRESASLPVNKCIYERLPYPSRSGLLEKAFIEWADRDSSVFAFCKVHRQKHAGLRLRYIKHDGIPAFYSPDFLVRTEDRVFLAETKAQDQTAHPNVLRKRKAALAWCERLNHLSPENRMDVTWRYALVGEDAFHAWRDKGASLTELLDYAMIRPAADSGQLELGLR